MEPAETREDLQAWLDEFEAAGRRPLRLRMRYAFIKTYRPVLDDEPFRAFDRMADYRAWCESALPSWLGSKAATNRVKDRESPPRLRAFRDYWASRRRG